MCVFFNKENNTDEELCNRWMSLSAFTPFFRNHNQRGALPQEPYRWDSVANASRIAIGVRYSLLPYWVKCPPPPFFFFSVSTNVFDYYSLSSTPSLLMLQCLERRPFAHCFTSSLKNKSCSASIGSSLSAVTSW